MKQYTNHKQSLELKRLKDFPKPDLVMEFFWAAENHPVHMKQDEKTIRSHEDVDIIPAWSLGKLIEALPGSISYCESDEEDYVQLTYNLHICPEGDGKMAEVKYVLFDNTKVLFETEALDLIDAIFRMIMKLNDLGWYK